MNSLYNAIIPLLFGWLCERVYGRDIHSIFLASHLKRISYQIKNKLNNDPYYIINVTILTIIFSLITFICTKEILSFILSYNQLLYWAIGSLIVFFCLSGKKLINEVQDVFQAVEESIDNGRDRLSQISWEDTTNLSSQQIRIDALEVLAKDFNTEVIATLFWYLTLGIPGMITYKLIYILYKVSKKSKWKKDLGRWNKILLNLILYIPTRLSAFLMLLSEGIPKGSFRMVFKQDKGFYNFDVQYPEAALATLLHCRLGGPYFFADKPIEAPYIDDCNRLLTIGDLNKAISIQEKSEILMILFMLLTFLIVY